MSETRTQVENIDIRTDNTVIFELRRTRHVKDKDTGAEKEVEVVFRYQVETKPFAWGAMGVLFNAWLISPQDSPQPDAKQISLAFKVPNTWDLSNVTDPSIYAERAAENAIYKRMLAAEYSYMVAVAQRNPGLAVVGLDLMTEAIQGFLENNVIIMEKIENENKDEDEHVLSSVLEMYSDGIGIEGTIALLQDVAQVVDTEADAGNLMLDNIKPSNIFVCYRPAGARLADFGLRVDKNKAISEAVGTPVHMAPEQYLKETLVHETLVYQMATLAYELLTGVPLNNMTSPKAAEEFVLNLTGQIGDRMLNLRSHLSQLAQLIDGQPQLSEQQITNVETVFRFALNRNPKKRYHRCAHFLKALEDALTKDNQLWFPDDFVAADDLGG